MKKWLIWNVFFRAHEAAKRHATYRFLREMESADTFSADELAQLQRQKLRDLIDYAFEHVPYFRDRLRELGATSADIRDVSDLALLPLLRKSDVRQNREALRSNIAGKLSSFTTGGSTGEPLIFDLAKRRVASRVACRQRTSRWWDVSVGDRELAIWGAPVELKRQDWIREFRDLFLSTQLLSAFELSEATVSRYLDVLEGGRYRQVFGYPSALHLVCAQAQREKRNLRRLGVKVAFVTGEVLLPYQREQISDTLNCPVANWYGGRDSALIAHECPQGGMHVLADAVIVQTVGRDGKPVPYGEPGEIVITDLYSHEAPFIRYATGDIGVLSSRRCACGRVLPLLERIEGRSNDVILAADGRMINSLALIYAVREVEGIEQFRITQKTVTSFHVQVVTNGSFTPDGEEHIRISWSGLFRSAIKVTFEHVAELPVERSGKFRHVVSEIAHNN
jgi:phenylacetate-CoA ligase